LYRKIQYNQNNIVAIKTATPENLIKKWIAENYGSLSEVAREEGVTPVTVHLIAFGKRQSRDLRVERALKALGCPIQKKIS
jgi:hypothetical protein